MRAIVLALLVTGCATNPDFGNRLQKAGMALRGCSGMTAYQCEMLTTLKGIERKL